MGRCSETILKGTQGLVTVFVLEEVGCKANESRRYGVSEERSQTDDETGGLEQKILPQ